MRYPLLIIVGLLLAAPAWAWNPYVAGCVGDSGPSALYTAATAIWDFENNANDTKDTYDLTANNSPTYSSSDYRQGSYAAVLDDSSTQYFSHADNSAFDVGSNTDFSVSLWLKCDDVANGLNVLGKYLNGNGYRFQNYYDAGYGVAVFLFASWSNTQTNTGVISSDTWYHFVLAFDADATDEITVWVSGATFGSISNGASFNSDVDPAANTTPLTVGGYDSTHTFSGLIDEVAWFKGTALTASQAQAIYGGSWR